MCPLFVYYGNQPSLTKKTAIIILGKMITIEKRHFRSKQDFHLELSPIGNLKSFMTGPPVAKETLVLISTIHHRVAQLGLTISTIHRRVAQLGLTISTIHRRVAHKELRSYLNDRVYSPRHFVNSVQHLCRGNGNNGQV